MMRLASGYVCLAVLVGCGGTVAPAPTTPVPPPPPAPVAAATAAAATRPATRPVLTGPVHDRAAQIRRAGDLLDQAQQTLALGDRSGAEVLFSTAELLVGPEALAAVASSFRSGGPPRITTAPIAVADAPPQPAAVGNSDDDEAAEAASARKPPRPPARGSLAGTLKIGGRAGGSLALVTLEPVGRRWKPRPVKRRVMEQRDRQFAPRLMLVPTGSTVQFPNFDDIFHNVFSTTDGGFDLGLYRRGEAREVTFRKEGILRVGCNIHANMSATVVVIDAPHYVIADASGAFAFRSLTPGRYTLRAWSEQSKAPITQAITVAVGANAVEVGVDADAQAGAIPDKFGAPRGK